MDEYVLRVESPPKGRELEAAGWVFLRLEEVRKQYDHVFRGAPAPGPKRRGIQRTAVTDIEAEVARNRRKR